jgi:hypothetical protein
MRTKTLIRILMATALLIMAISVTGSAQIYQRNSYDRFDRRQVRDAINQLNNTSVQLERNLSVGRQRRILGVFSYSTVDSAAVVEVREFRRAVAELRRSVRGDFSLDSSRDEALAVINRGLQLDRYLRLRTGSASVDADLANIRSSIHLLADAYDINLSYRY